jgi:hypothetical protein
MASRILVDKPQRPARTDVMTDEVPRRRADGSWQEQRDAIAQRNAAVRKRATAERKQRNVVADDALREEARREREDLQALNAQIDRQRGR